MLPKASLRAWCCCMDFCVIGMGSDCRRCTCVGYIFERDQMSQQELHSKPEKEKDGDRNGTNPQKGLSPNLCICAAPRVSHLVCCWCALDLALTSFGYS
jgi:hypothetical protein